MTTDDWKLSSCRDACTLRDSKQVPSKKTGLFPLTINDWKQLETK